MSRVVFFALVCALVVINGVNSKVDDVTATAQPLDGITSTPSINNRTVRPLTKLIGPLTDIFGRRFISAIKNQQRAKVLSEEQLLHRKYVDFADDIESATSESLSALLPIAMDILKDIDMGDRCAASLFEFARGLRHQKPWAVRMLDASGGVPRGLLAGSYADFGNYDSCLSVVSSDLNNDLSGDEEADDYDDADRQGHESAVRFEGKYCLLTFGAQLSSPSVSNRGDSFELMGGGIRRRRPAMTAEQFALMFKNTSAEGTAIDEYARHLIKYQSLAMFKIGLCIPSVCSASDLGEAFAKFFDRLNLPIDRLQLGPSCATHDPEHSTPFRLSQWISLTIIGCLLLLVIVGTAVDISGVKLERRGVQSVAHLLLMCFSLRRNTRRLTFVQYVPSGLSGGGHPDEDEEDTEQDRAQRMTALHGVRVLFMVALVIVNTYWIVGIRNFSNFSNTFTAFDSTLSSGLFVATVLNGWQYITDAFLVLSGLLLTSALLPKLDESKGKLNYFELTFHRWLRLWPGLVGATCLYTLWPLLARGPLATSESVRQLDACDSSAWSSLIFISNWMPINNCVPTAWALSVEFQLFLVAPPLVYIIHRNWLVGRRLLMALATLFSLLTATVTVGFRLNSLITVEHLLDMQLLQDHVQVTLLPTFARAPAYLIGMIAGYYCVRSGKMRRFSALKKYLILLALIASLIATTMLALSHHVSDRDNSDGDDVESSAAQTSSAIITFIISFLLRPLWCSVIGWLAFSLSSVGGRFLKGLAARPLQRTSRLLYSFTLVHLIPIMIRSTSANEVQLWSNGSLLTDSLINLLFAMVLAYALHVTFEAPFLAIERGVKQRIEHNEVTKLRSLRPANISTRVNDVEC